MSKTMPADVSYLYSGIHVEIILEVVVVALILLSLFVVLIINFTISLNGTFRMTISALTIWSFSSPRLLNSPLPFFPDRIIPETELGEEDEDEEDNDLLSSSPCRTIPSTLAFVIILP